jgi:hypothetical protein
MDRRGFAKQVLGIAAMGAVLPKVVWEQRLEERGDHSYSSATISVRLLEEQPGRTSVYLTEHGDADYAIVDAFYWSTFDNQRILLHKETTAPLVKESTVGADLPMTVASIVFLRVYELKLLSQSEFGKVPSTAPAKT